MSANPQRLQPRLCYPPAQKASASPIKAPQGGFEIGAAPSMLGKKTQKRTTSGSELAASNQFHDKAPAGQARTPSPQPRSPSPQRRSPSPQRRSCTQMTPKSMAVTDNQDAAETSTKVQEIANLPDTLLQEYLSFVVEKYFNDQVDSLQWAYESSKGKAREPAIQCFDACALRLAKATWKLERLKKVLSQAPALLLALSSHASAAMNLRDAVFQAPKHCTVSANALQILLNTVSSWAGQHAEALTALGVFPALVSLGVTHSAATAAASPAASSVQPAAAATAVAVEQESSTSFKGRMRAFALDLHEADTAAKGSVKCLQEQQAARIDEIAATEAETGRWAERAANAHDRLAVKHSEHMAWKYQPEVQAAMSKALVTLRSIVPPNICSMSQQNIFDDFAAEGIRMPPHLAAELKGNQLLPLLVLHSSALHKSKLALDSLEIYGLEELMALAAVLPDELENDPRKLKAEWMDSFYDCLMKKYNRFIGATELAEYDGVAGQRKQVTMTPLSDQEQVREVFFHEAAPELHLRVMNCQQREQEAKRLKDGLNAAKIALAKATEERKDCKSDIRSGGDQLSSLTQAQKDDAVDFVEKQFEDAKRSHESAQAKCKKMSTDTTGGMTAEDWLSMSAQLQEYMTRKGYPAWEEAEVRIYRVEGIYDGTMEPAAPPLAQDDGVYRQLSAEEEVALRNSEKLAAIAAKNIAAQSGEVSSPPPAATTTPKYKATPQKLVVPGNFASSLKISLVLAHRSATLNTPIPTLSGKKVKFAAQEDASASVVDDDPAASTPALKSVVLQRLLDGERMDGDDYAYKRPAFSLLGGLKMGASVLRSGAMRTPLGAVTAPKRKASRSEVLAKLAAAAAAATPHPDNPSPPFCPEGASDKFTPVNTARTERAQDCGPTINADADSAPAAEAQPANLVLNLAASFTAVSGDTSAPSPSPDPGSSAAGDQVAGSEEMMPCVPTEAFTAADAESCNEPNATAPPSGETRSSGAPVAEVAQPASGAFTDAVVPAAEQHGSTDQQLAGALLGLRVDVTFPARSKAVLLEKPASSSSSSVSPLRGKDRCSLPKLPLTPNRRRNELH